MNLQDFEYSDINIYRTLKGLCGVYILRHMATGKYYIGSTSNLQQRLRNHHYKLESSKHENKLLQTDYSNGSDISVAIIITSNKENALNEEQRLLDEYYSTGILYNIAKDSRATHKDRKMDDSVKHKIRLGRIGKKHTPEVRKRLSEFRMGKKIPRELVEKLRARNLGATRPISTGVNISKALIGREVTDETRAKLSVVGTGRRLTPEQKAHRAANMAMKNRRVIIEGIVYKNTIDAATAFNVNYSTVRYRINSIKENFSGWNYLD